MTPPALPQRLEPVTGPIPADRIEGAVAALGGRGAATAALVERGFVPPDLLASCTVRLLAGQPRRPQPPAPGDGGAAGAKASPIAGGVWVREQVSFHHPVRIGDDVVIEGETVRRYVRKGRSYSTTVARTTGGDGRLLVSNITTGLTEYRADPDRADDDEGTEPPPIEPERDGPAPDLGAPGREIRSDPVVVNLEMMRARDGARSDNPIHSDPEVARRAGLAAPIAGGNHVLSFALELVLAEWGADALLAGSSLDIRWLAQVRAGDSIVSTVQIRDASGLGLTVEGADRTCLVARMEVAR